MSLHVFDSSSFRVMKNYYPDRFPNFWQSFDKSVESGMIISVKEVLSELRTQDLGPHLQAWLRTHRRLFLPPGDDETEFVAEIMRQAHFQQLVGAQQRLKGAPVADPFIIASARVRKGCVVTQESMKANAARIPNVCKYFKVPCCNLEEFMEKQGWRF